MASPAKSIGKSKPSTINGVSDICVTAIYGVVTFASVGVGQVPSCANFCAIGANDVNT